MKDAMISGIRSAAHCLFIALTLLAAWATGTSAQEGGSVQDVARPADAAVAGAPDLAPWGATPSTVTLGLQSRAYFDGAPAPPPVAPLAAAPRQADEEWTDPWGQPRNTGLAILEVWMGNFLPWVLNEFVPSRADLRISQLSPRSWWRNITEGWKWDDNAFQVNHFAHPFQGNIYFNGARSNGYGYWGSLLAATAGSFNWECCGETHFMSINDWVNTSIGGAAVGEVLYRTTSRILDNQATGAERIFREAAVFMLNPNRGFTRMVTGNATRVYENPDDPLDYRTPTGHSHISVGMRGGSSTRTAATERDQDLPRHGFVRAEVHSGSLADLSRGKPFDYFRFSTQVNFISGRGLGEILIQGNLWHKNLGESESSTSKFVIVQDFEYNNNSSFEQGGQGVSFMYFRDGRLGENTHLSFNAAATWTLLGGVRSEMAFAADVEGIRERYREYDFGVGPGMRAGFELEWKDQHVLEGSYRAQYLETLNGAEKEGFGSDHLTQLIRFRAMLPVEIAGLGVGADYELHLRRSNFELEDVGLVKQHSDIWQIFARWTP